MRRFIFTAMTALLLAQLANATTYFKNWVNGSESNTMTQGDMYAWEYDVSVVGGSAQIKIFVDTNGNHTVDAGDVLLIQFEQQDGVSGEDGPGDSSAVADGIIYSEVGPFGFGPENYLLQVEDQNDMSTITGTLHINAPATVNVLLTGHIDMEGVQAPDDRLAYFMFSMEPDDEDGPFWSGLTDANGDFTINLPDDAVNSTWKLSPMFSAQISDWVLDPDSYHGVNVHTGINSGYTFMFNSPRAWVYGSVLDEDGNVVPSYDWGGLYNVHSDMENDFMAEEGHFKVAAPFSGSDTLNVPFHLDFWGESLIPNYMTPVTWDNPLYNFNLSIGDSVQKNIYVYSTGAVIYATATIDGHPVGGNYEVRATNTDIGQTYTMLDSQAVVELHVHPGNTYNVSLGVHNDEFYAPPGYYLEGDNWREAQPGDTVHFVFLPSQSRLSGRISYQAGDPVGTLKDCNVEAWDFNWINHYNGTINEDSMNYSIAVPNGSFSVQLNCWNSPYLSMPAQYSNIEVTDGEVDTLDFELNYAFAELQVKLVNAPLSQQPDLWMGVSTVGEYPWIYQANQEISSDSTFYFQVCEGQWQIFAPYFDENHVVDRADTLVNVAAGQNTYYVEFHYTDLTGIGAERQIPRSFYVKQNYPNPFNPTTTIEFGLPQQQHVTVDVFNLNGQKVATLANGMLSAGVHRLHWNGQGYASGMYFYKIATPKKTEIHRMLLIK